MRAYLARRALLAAPTLILVSVLVFSLMHLIPGDAVIARLQEIGVVTNETLNAMRRELGLDKPFYQQLGEWLWGLARGDLGQSLWTREPAVDRLLAALPVSAELALGGLALAVLIAVPLGVLSAIRQDTWTDYIARLFAIFGISLPDFWVGTLLILYLSLWFGFLPPLGYVSPFDDPLRNLEQFFLPVVVLGFRLSATTARMMRASMLDVLRQDYVRTARAKGLREGAVIYRHALKNAVIPVVTILGTQLSAVLGGTVILETLFSLPGVGFLTFSSIGFRDYTQIQANVLFLAAVLVFLNLLVDISYSWLDPRIRYSK
jgi:peptide/nickel transport system permease protein